MILKAWSGKTVPMVSAGGGGNGIVRFLGANCMTVFNDHNVKVRRGKEVVGF